MSNRPIAYVMEQTLGSITHYLNLRHEESEAGPVRPLWLPIAYRATRLPWAMTGSLDARREMARVIDQIDGLFVHTTTLSLFSADFFRRKPAVLSCDGTPIKREMRAAYGLRPQSRVAERTKRIFYRRIFQLVKGMVAWSEWAKSSLIEDYGCSEKSITVIPPGVDVGAFTPGEHTRERPRILFVGGDFQRKGGELLLQAFRKRLLGRADLVLVTNAELPAEPGIEIHHNIPVNSPELRALYAQADIFALPTHADTYSLVCLEALAAGLPVVTTRVGGIPELVREGITGHLIECGNVEALGDALESLVADPARRRKMSEACRADALARFDGRTNARRLFEFVRSCCGD